MAKDPQLERMIARELGAEKPAEAAPKAPKKPPEPSEEPTVQEKAAKQASPKTEGDKQQEEAVMYAVKMGDQTRNLTPQQIAGTFERYKDLNFKNQQMAPINKWVESLMNPTNGKKYSPEQVAKFLEAGAKAMTKNVTMGEQRPQNAGVATGGPPKQPSSMQRNMSDEFNKYEDENAISLPPGYREAAERMNRMEQQIQAQNVAMQQMMQGAQGAAQMGQQSAKNAQNDRATAIRNTIANNLNAAQQANGLSDSDAKAFMAYAGERGYTAEDFADKGLTDMVVADFKNNRNSPEFNRLQDMAKRRQSYLASNTPSGGAANAPKADRRNAGQMQFDRLADRAMKNRMG